MTKSCHICLKPIEEENEFNARDRMHQLSSHECEGRTSFDDLCESIDAEIFSSDFLYCGNLVEFKEYLARWSKAVKEHEESLAEMDKRDE